MKTKTTIMILTIILILLIPVTVEATEKTDFFSEDITYKYEYLQDDGGMKYALFTPSTAKENQSLPLIIFLHGLSSPEYREERYFKAGGWVACFNDWEKMNLEGFNAYVLCPHTKSNSPWTNNTEQKQFKQLLDNIIEEKNIDKDNIIIAGHSSGANGAIYMVYNMPEYFSKCVLMSGFGFQHYCTSEEYKALGIETRAYTGNVKKGEYSYSVNPTKNEFEPIFGSENTFYIEEASHTEVPKQTLLIDVDGDSDGNNRSDVIEWMLDGYTIPGSSANTNSTNSTNKKNKRQGGKLVIGISQMMCFIPDSVISICQNMLLNDKSVEEDGVYTIYYSPATIFSGQIPAFDVNFIKPNTEENGEINYDIYLDAKVNDYYNSATPISDYLTKIEEIEGNTEYQHKSGNNDTYRYNIYYKVNDNVLTIKAYFIEMHEDNRYNYYEYISTESIDEKLVEEINASTEYKSTAEILQNTIATFYNALRRIALVGLLSVLVYIGIRILLTSTSANDKAKYKNMLKDWFIALCILFTLHYIMSITVTVVEHINEVVKASTIGVNGEDIMMTKLRNDIANGRDWAEVLVQVVLYFVLAVYIIIFTIQYFRRTIYLAFLTIISPLITLTYPLDKIKDNKSQAFDMWVKDYIFFSLLQVIHLLIYYILVGSSIDLSNEGNWIFAIVAIGFLIPAEKLIKKMFGFEKSKSMGALAAGTTGALVMNAINKITPKSGGKSSSSSKEKGSSNNVRTAANDALESLRTGTSSGDGSFGLSTDKSNPIGNGWKGAGSVAGKYGTRAIKGAMKGTAKGFVGATGAMVGFAAGVAQGDVSAALTGAVAGGKAGSSLAEAGINTAKSIPGGIKNAVNNLTDTWNEGAYGADIAQSKKEIRDFKSSSTYKSLKGTFGDELTDEKVGLMIDAGIKEKGDMEKILKEGNINDAIGYYSLAKKCPDSIYYDDQKLQMYLEDLGISQTNAKTMRDNMRKFR